MNRANQIIAAAGHRICANGLSDTEVGELNGLIGGNKHILRLYIPMYIACVMNAFKGVKD